MGNVVTNTEMIFLFQTRLVICSKLNNGITTTDLKQTIATAHKQG